MPHDSPQDHAQLYASAFQAQAKAIRARRRKQQRSHRANSAAADPGGPTHRPSNTFQAVSPSQRRGARAEESAARYIHAQGLTLLARNLRCKAGEIDLIARDHDCLVFIEVRQRRSLRYGGGAASIDRRKQQRLIRAAHYFLPDLTRTWFAGVTPPSRFDVVSLHGPIIHWIPNAFDSSG